MIAMNSDVKRFRKRDPEDVEFLAGIRARRLQRSREPVPNDSPWLVTAAAIVSGIVLAALIITAAYLTPPLGR
jgi:hypothetical protein